MDPGRACNGCHSFTLAGTVYSTGHQKDLCKGDNSGTQIVITDASNQSFSLNVNSAGNFYGNGNLQYPIKVKVVSGSKERPMTTPLDSSMGDCNSCHSSTGSGSPKAPGRITVPF